MRTKISGFLFVMAMTVVLGCHRMNVDSVKAQLRIGMSKAELDQVMKAERFIREQVVKVRPGSNEIHTRAAIRNNKIYKYVSPEDLIEVRLPFDESVTAYSYLIKEEHRFANTINVEALFVFVDTKKDAVIGWADIDGLVETRLWNDYF
jgi:hypothetical protein